MGPFQSNVFCNIIGKPTCWIAPKLREWNIISAMTAGKGLLLLFLSFFFLANQTRPRVPNFVRDVSQVKAHTLRLWRKKKAGSRQLRSGQRERRPLYEERDELLLRLVREFSPLGKQARTKRSNISASVEISYSTAILTPTKQFLKISLARK